MYVTAFNPGTSPVVTSAAGTVLGGGDWGSVQTTEDVVQGALDADQLVKVTHPEDRDDISKAARRAMDRTDELNDRVGVLGELDKPALVKHARSVGALDEDAEEPHRADLERDLIEGDYDLPKKRASKPAAAQTTPAK